MGINYIKINWRLYLGFGIGIPVFILGLWTVQETRWGYESTTSLFGIFIMMVGILFNHITKNE